MTRPLHPHEPDLSVDQFADYRRLLIWFFFDPDQIVTRLQNDEHAPTLARMGARIVVTLFWLPLGVLFLAALAGRWPLETSGYRFLTLVAIIGLFLAWQVLIEDEDATARGDPITDDGPPLFLIPVAVNVAFFVCLLDSPGRSGDLPVVLALTLSIAAGIGLGAVLGYDPDRSAMTMFHFMTLQFFAGMLSIIAIADLAGMDTKSVEMMVGSILFTVTWVTGMYWIIRAIARLGSAHQTRLAATSGIWLRVGVGVALVIAYGVLVWATWLNGWKTLADTTNEDLTPPVPIATSPPPISSEIPGLANIGLAFMADETSDRATVVSVLDGSTIQVTNGIMTQTVRYLGIRPQHKLTECGQSALLYNTMLVDGQEVYLQKDVTDRDAEGRLLRYVYVPATDTFVNFALVLSGLADPVSTPPDTAYVVLLATAAEQARLRGHDECLSGTE